MRSDNNLGSGGGRHSVSLHHVVATWPTPRGEDAECCGNHPDANDSLTGATSKWHTPRANDAEKRGDIDMNDARNGIAGQSILWSTPHAHNAQGTPGSGTTERGGRHRDLAREAMDHTQNPDRGGQACRMTEGGGLRKLEDQAEFWQTPGTDSFRSRGGERKDEMGLDQQARTWGTPTSRDWKDGGGELGQHTGERIAIEAAYLPDFPPGPADRESWERILAIRPDLAPATQPEVRGVDDELAHRVDRLRACGNGVVPIQAAFAFSVLTRRVRMVK
jgi:hypothetical protein